jgi:hypothetical protein
LSFLAVIAETRIVGRQLEIELSDIPDLRAR